MKNGSTYLLSAAVVISSALIMSGLRDIATSIKSLKPTIQLTSNPTTVKVVEGPRPSGLLPGVR